MGSSALNLVVVGGIRQGETLEFQPGASIRIGRVVRGNTLPIKDAGISTKHLCIEFDFNSAKWLIRDLDSSNGTFLNGTCLTPKTPFDLNDGDSIKLGEETSILIKIDCHCESQLRRNPRRGAVVKDCNIGAIAKTRGHDGMAMGESTVNHNVEGDAIMKLESRRKGTQRRARGLKDENGDQTAGNKTEEHLGVIIENSQNPGRQGVALKDSTVVHEVEGDKIMVLDGRRQGRRGKRRVLKNETGDQAESKKTEELLGVITHNVQNQICQSITLKDSAVNHEDAGDKMVMAESQRRGKARKARVLNNKNGDKGPGKTEELLDVIKGDSQNQGHRGAAVRDSTVEHQTTRDNFMMLDSRRSGRPRNVRVLKNEICPEVGDLQNAGPVEGNIGGRMSTRRNCALKKGDENAEAKSILTKIPENLCLEGEKGGAKVRRTRAGGRKRNNSTVEHPENVEVNNLEDNKDLKKGNPSTVTLKDPVEKMENNNVRVATVVSDVCENEDKDEIEEHVEIDSKTDVKKNEGAEKLDLEKMTAQEWFHYLEAYLPAKIIAETEEIIEDMKQKAARVREYVSQQRKNLPLA